MKDEYDIEISDFDVNLGKFKGAEEHFLEAIPCEQLRDSDEIIKKTTILKENVVNLSPESDSFLVTIPIFLENSHRFKNYPEWGEIMGRIRTVNDTLEDRQEMNKRYQKPSERKSIPPEATTACVSNKERNAIECRA